MEVFNAIGAAIQQGASSPISLRCPACRQRGSFEALGNPADALLQNNFRAGLRRCPNTSCGALVFFVSDVSYTSLHVTYPPEVIDFDATGLPTRVLDSFQEAIRCHSSGCYVAAAMMVRKTLEVLCEDRGAGGDNLRQRVQALRSKVIMPAELFEASDDLRLLGNDAAHIEAHSFDHVGKEEVEVAIDLVKEILKATYQYGALLEKLRAYRS